MVWQIATWMPRSRLGRFSLSGTASPLAAGRTATGKLWGRTYCWRARSRVATSTSLQSISPDAEKVGPDREEMGPDPEASGPDPPFSRRILAAWAGSLDPRRVSGSPALLSQLL